MRVNKFRIANAFRDVLKSTTNPHALGPPLPPVDGDGQSRRSRHAVDNKKNGRSKSTLSQVDDLPFTPVRGASANLVAQRQGIPTLLRREVCGRASYSLRLLSSMRLPH